MLKPSEVCSVSKRHLWPQSTVNRAVAICSSPAHNYSYVSGVIQSQSCHLQLGMCDTIHTKRDGRTGGELHARSLALLDLLQFSESK